MASRLSWSSPFYIGAGTDERVNLLLNGETLYPLRPYKRSSINTSLDLMAGWVWSSSQVAQAALDEILEEGVFIDVTLDEMIEFLDDMIARGVRI